MSGVCLRIGCGSGHTEAVLSTGPLLRYSAAFRPCVPETDSRGTGATATDEGLSLLLLLPPAESVCWFTLF